MPKPHDITAEERARLEEAIRTAPTIEIRRILIAERDGLDTGIDIDDGATHGGEQPPVLSLPPQGGVTEGPAVGPEGDEPPPVVTPDSPRIGDHVDPNDVLHDPFDYEGPTPELPPEIVRCARVRSAARRGLAARANHWWQNWGKTQAYVCQRMAFPTSVDQIGVAVAYAESEELPVRAVGGGWSFSDVTLPGEVTMPTPPQPLGVEALTSIVPRAETFSPDPDLPLIAEVEEPAPGGPPDGPGLLSMLDGNGEVNTTWTYLGGGRWSSTRGPLPVAPLRRVNLAFLRGNRPVLSGDDEAGALAMFDLATGAFLPNVFYNGGGVWTLGVMGTNALQLSLAELVPRLPRTVQPRPSTPAFSMALITRSEPVLLINTFSLASSLQCTLPDILCEEALEATDPGPIDDPNPSRRHFFHVEAGITLQDLSKLLEHQSPPLALDATAGSPGSTLAGSLATATHGGENRNPGMVDRVKAIHLVGPGGLQWWIEGDEPIADPDKLLEIYPCLARDRIIRGPDPVHGVLPQDWLNAAVVSMGCMGVVYSVVLEVVPVFGIHEVVVESTWRRTLANVSYSPRAPGHYGPRGTVFASVDELRDARSAPPEDRAQLGRALLGLFDGDMTGISRWSNRYIDIAIDPNPIGGATLAERNWNCWVINREVTRAVPFEPKPTPKDTMGRVGDSIGDAIGQPAIRRRLLELHGAEYVADLLDENWLEALDIGGAVHMIEDAIAYIERMLRSSDTIHAALDLLTRPFEESSDPYNLTGDFNTASAIVSGLFSGLLGVEDGRGEATDRSSRVGAIGFPSSGLMGTAIEVALSVEDAFPFIQNEILDRIERPFFGYVSVRVCPRTRALLGMQQHDPSIMVELVAFGTPSARAFVADVQRRTVERIRDGLDAMLHWGLENDQLDAAALRSIPSITSGSPSKLEKFRTVRSLIRDAATEGPDVFDSEFTRRLDL